MNNTCSSCAHFALGQNPPTPELTSPQTSHSQEVLNCVYFNPWHSHYSPTSLGVLRPQFSNFAWKPVTLYFRSKNWFFFLFKVFNYAQEWPVCFIQTKMPVERTRNACKISTWLLLASNQYHQTWTERDNWFKMIKFKNILKQNRSLKELWEANPRIFGNFPESTTILEQVQH